MIIPAAPVLAYPVIIFASHASTAPQHAFPVLKTVHSSITPASPVPMDTTNLQEYANYVTLPAPPAKQSQLLALPAQSHICINPPVCLVVLHLMDMSSAMYALPAVMDVSIVP